MKKLHLYFFSLTLLLASVLPAHAQIDGIVFGDGGMIEDDKTTIERESISSDENIAWGLRSAIYANSHLTVPTEFSNGSAPASASWIYHSEIIRYAEFISQNQIPITRKEFAEFLILLKQKNFNSPGESSYSRGYEILNTYLSERSEPFQLDVANLILENLHEMDYESAKYWFRYYDLKYKIKPSTIDQALSKISSSELRIQIKFITDLVNEAKQRNYQIPIATLLNVLEVVYSKKVRQDILYGRDQSELGDLKDLNLAIRQIREYISVQTSEYQEKIVHLFIEMKLRWQLDNPLLTKAQRRLHIKPAINSWQEYLLANHLETTFNEVEFTEEELVSVIRSRIEYMYGFSELYNNYLKTKKPNYVIRFIDLILSEQKVSESLLAELYTLVIDNTFELSKETVRKALDHAVSKIGIFGSTSIASKWLDYAKIFHASADWSSYETEINRPRIFGSNSRLLAFFRSSRVSDEPEEESNSQQALSADQEYPALTVNQHRHNMLRAQPHSVGETNRFLYQLSDARFVALRELFGEMNLQLLRENNSSETEAALHLILYALEREKKGSALQQKLLSAAFIALLQNNGSNISDLVGFQGAFEKTFEVKLILPEPAPAAAIASSQPEVVRSSAAATSPPRSSATRGLVVRQTVPTANALTIAADRILLRLRTNVIDNSWLEVARATLQREAIAAHMESLSKYIELLNPNQYLSNLRPQAQTQFLGDVRALRTASLALPKNLRNHQLIDHVNNYLNDTSGITVGDFFNQIAEDLPKLKAIYADPVHSWEERYKPGYYQRLENGIRLEIAKVLMELAEEGTKLTDHDIVQVIEDLGQLDGEFKNAFAEFSIQLNSEHTLLDGRKINPYHEFVDGIRIALNEMIEQANLPIAQFKMLSGKSNGLSARLQVPARSELESEPNKVRVLEIGARMLRSR